MNREDIIELVNNCEKELDVQFMEVDKVCEINTFKILESFKKNGVSEVHFNSTTGYGYNDIGRSVIEQVYCDIFNCEAALVRNQFISASHALNVCLFAILRPNDTMLTITGTPYDTLHEVIGLKENNSSLKSFGINYEDIDLIDNDFDYDKIKDSILNKKYKLVHIQRSKGYSDRKSLTVDKVGKVIKFIKSIDKDVIIMVDNCYCELVSEYEVTYYGADLAVGSLIKNLGAGIASNGAYIVGKKELIDLCGERLTLPGEGIDVGPSLGANKEFLKALFFAPSVVSSSLKTAILTSYVLERLGYNVEPKYNDERADIVQNIIFNDRNLLIKYCQGIQSGSPIDSNALPIPTDMPGYDDEIIMASGSFTQGSSIEISCDGPLRSPYIAYQQGALTYHSGKYALICAIDYLLNK
ncbi:MAG: methionine gamma-lyase family protein [Bacilli bacterium]|nr:methionine gamma-lyase family protein [Bacilli bacterium]